MKKLILLELSLIFLATTFQSDNPPGWYLVSMPRTDVFVQDLSFLDSLTGHVVVRKNSNDSAFIFRTTDGGNNWATTLGEDIYLTSIQFVNNNIGYTVGSEPPGIIKKTTNGGQNWFTVSMIAAYPIWDLAFVNKDTGWICSDDGFAGGVFKTTNGGLNWQSQLGVSYFPYRLSFINKDTGWVISDNSTQLHRTTNGGGNWNLQYTFTGLPRDIFMVDKDTGWIIGVDTPGVFKTINGGNNWFSQPNPTAFGNAKIFFLNSKRGWIGSAFNRILITTNGVNWGYQTSPAFSSLSVSFTDTVRGWAGGSALVHTTDGGGPISGVVQISNEAPSKFKLLQNYPNPFNPNTLISYWLSVAGHIELVVYDVMGKEIAVMADEKQNAGEYRADFDGSSLSSGIYFYKLIVTDETGKIKFIDSKKMILIR